MAKIRCLRRLNGRYREEIRELEEICNIFDQTKGSVYLSTDMNANPDFRSFYMCYEEKLLGFIEVNFLEEEDVELFAFVHPEHRHRGIFKKLLDEVMKECNRFGVKEVLIRHNPVSTAAVPVFTAINAEYSHSEYQMQLPIVRLSSFIENLDYKSIELIKLDLEQEEFYTNTLCTVFDFDKEFANERFKEALTDRHITTFVAMEHDIKIGIFSLYFSGTSYTVFDFGICNEFQNQGKGKKLLFSMYEKIKTHGNSRAIRLLLHVSSTNMIAYRMYLKYGFEIQDQLDYYQLQVKDMIKEKKLHD